MEQKSEVRQSSVTWEGNKIKRTNIKIKNRFIRDNWIISVILVVATFFRFFRLGNLPPGLHPDEAANGLDVIGIIDYQQFAAIYDTNGPRESLLFFLQAIPVWVGEVTHWTFLNFTPLSLRIAPAAVGVATVFGIYLLGKELFTKNIGLFAAAALAVSSWHVQFSRDGFRGILTPLALVFLFYFLIKAYRNGRVRDYIGTGVSLALGFYTYLSYRMVPLALLAILGYITVTDRGFFKKNLKMLVVLASVFFVIMIPMFIHFLYVPADILGRSSTSILNPETNGGSPLGALTDNIVKTIGMFNVAGDQNFRHNINGLPMLDIFAGILMWIGVIISLAKIKKLEYFILVVWACALSLPEVLTSEGIPHALRMIGVIPVVFLWVALGLNWTLEKVKIKKPLLAGMVLILIISGTISFYRYFVLFPEFSESREAYAENMVEIARDIKNQPKDKKIILIAGEYGAKTIQFITYPADVGIKRYELYDIKSMELPRENYKIYIEREWKDGAVKELEKIGFDKGLTAVPSKADQRILYYEYSK